MSTKLAIAALVALSVSALIAELKSGEYSVDELKEALTAEAAGENRKTAIAAIEEASVVAIGPVETKVVHKPVVKKPKVKKPKKPPFYIMPGKCLTSKRGMLATERDASIADYAEIKAEDLRGGQEAIDAFVESGHVGEG